MIILRSLLYRDCYQKGRGCERGVGAEQGEGEWERENFSTGQQKTNCNIQYTFYNILSSIATDLGTNI